MYHFVSPFVTFFRPIYDRYFVNISARSNATDPLSRPIPEGRVSCIYYLVYRFGLPSKFSENGRVESAVLYEQQRVCKSNATARRNISIVTRRHTRKLAYFIFVCLFFELCTRLESYDCVWSIFPVQSGRCTRIAGGSVLCTVARSEDAAQLKRRDEPTAANVLQWARDT